MAKQSLGTDVTLRNRPEFWETDVTLRIRRYFEKQTLLWETDITLRNRPDYWIGMKDDAKDDKTSRSKCWKAKPNKERTKDFQRKVEGEAKKWLEEIPNDAGDVPGEGKMGARKRKKSWSMNTSPKEVERLNKGSYEVWSIMKEWKTSERNAFEGRRWEDFYFWY